MTEILIQLSVILPIILGAYFRLKNVYNAKTDEAEEGNKKKFDEMSDGFKLEFKELKLSVQVLKSDRVHSLERLLELSSDDEEKKKIVKKLKLFNELGD